MHTRTWMDDYLVTSEEIQSIGSFTLQSIILTVLAINSALYNAALEHRVENRSRY